MYLFLVLLHTLCLNCSIKRNFIPLPGKYALDSGINSNPLTLRVIQFNVLADGLSALRPDMGQFSRVSRDVLDWDARKYKLLEEISQYEPDVVTMQEVDHYYDFFHPELNKLGYTGYFAPKPTSACLEVSSASDGCALFIKRDKLRVISCEAKALALKIAGLSEGELIEDDRSLKLQNQVGLIAVCEFYSNNCYQTGRHTFCNDNRSEELKFFSPHSTNRGPTTEPPPIIICTTHLKSSKTATGERYRQKGILQILDMVDILYTSFAAGGRTPGILFTGDFNAIPEVASYGPQLTFNAIKAHQLNLRSVYNDDSSSALYPLSNPRLYTTWKARNTNAGEIVIQRCIDYIFYSRYIGKYSKKSNGDGQDNGFSADSDIETSLVISSINISGSNGNESFNEDDDYESMMSIEYDDSESPGYMNDLITNSLASDLNIKSTPLQSSKVITVVSSSRQVAISLLLRSIVYFTCSFLPVTAPFTSSLNLEEIIFLTIYSLTSLLLFEKFLDTESTPFNPTIPSKINSDIEVVSTVPLLSQSALFVKATALGKRVFQRKLLLKRRPGLQPVALLDLFTDEEVGPDFMPSTRYPSDHIAIGADFQLIWDDDDDESENGTKQVSKSLEGTSLF